MKEDLIVEKRKRKIKDFLLKKKILFVVVGLIVLLILAWHTRTVNLPALKDITTEDYTLGPDLDPFLFLRYSEEIIENGKIPQIDYMRNVPLGFDTAVESKLLPYMIVYLYKVLNIFSSVSITYSAVIFPAVMFLLIVIAFYLFIYKVFENKKNKAIIAFISTALLIVSVSLLPRTVAGIPEKESAAFFFMFLSFYLFLSAWKSIKLKKGVILAGLAGVSTGLMGMIWGGVRYIFIIIAFAVFIEFILGKVSKKKFLFYATWFLVSFLMLVVLFAARYPFINMINAPNFTGLSLAVLILVFTDILIFKTKIKNINFIQNLRRKIPDRFISMTIFVIVIIIAGSLLFRISFLPDSINNVVTALTRSTTDRLSYTVAENKQPFFKEWEGNFGPRVKEIALVFWLFFIGSIFLFYDAIKNMKKKSKLILLISYILFLLALIFSRYSTNSIMNGVNSISKVTYIGSFLFLFGGFFYSLYDYHKKRNTKELKKVNSSYLFLLAFFFISLIGARSAVRLAMVLAAPAAGIIGYFCVSAVVKANKSKDKTMRVIFILLASIVILATMYSFYVDYKSTISSAKGMVPSAYTQQWQKAMSWVRENTPTDSVFAHWWDYGYWLQSIGKRATILDGGNAIGYWNHLLGRYVLTGQSQKEALDFLYTHNATYLLIDSTEIGKYGAYSLIGSDENYDRYSQIATFVEDESNLRETKEEFVHLYVGSQVLDEDYLIEQEGKKELLPAFKAGIGGVFYIEGKNGEIKQPSVVFIYQGGQINLPLRYVYFKDKLYDFGEGYGGALYLFPNLESQGGKMAIKEKGTALFLTERSMRALWVRLYLLGEEGNFELVHTEENFVVRDLRNQGWDSGDFVYFQGIQGPIKIWKINYPENVEFKPEYLETDYPQSLRENKGFI